MAAVAEALEDASDMDLSTYLAAAFEGGAAQIWVYRVVPGGEEYKVASLTPDTPIPGDPELHMIDKFGGPGTFIFTPAVPSNYGGFLKVKNAKSKRMRIGVANEGDAGQFTGIGTDLDSRMSRLLAREEKMHALHQIQDLNAKWDEKGGAKNQKEDDVKSEDVAQLVTVMSKSQETVLAMMQKQMDLEIARVNASSVKNPLEALAPVLAPVLGFLDKKLTPGTVTKWLAAFKENPTNTEEGGFWPSLFSAAKEYLPYLQPMLQEIMTKVQPSQPQPAQPAQPPLRLVEPRPTTPPQPTGGADVQREYDDPDTKEMLDFAIQCIDEGNFPDAFASLRSNDETMDIIARIAPGASAQSFWFMFRDLDDRLRTRKDACLNFIEYVQKCVTALQEEIAKSQLLTGAKPTPEPPASA